MTKPLLITMGDAAGIGPEIIAKAFAESPADLADCIVAGDVATLRRATALIASQTGALALPVIRHTVRRRRRGDAGPTGWFGHC